MKKRAENDNSLSKQIRQNGQIWRGKNEILVYFPFIDCKSFIRATLKMA